MNLATNRATKYRGVDGATVGFLATGAYPYVYTDGSGLTTRNSTVNRLGTWTVVYDSGAAGTPWGKVDWNDLVPTGALVEVAVRSSDNRAALDLQTYAPVAKNIDFPGTGRYLQVRTRMQMNQAQETPVLYDLTVTSRETSTGTICDIDRDGDVDSADLEAVRASIGATVGAGDLRDPTGDGRVTINDVRACSLRCTRATCASS